MSTSTKYTLIEIRNTFDILLFLKNNKIIIPKTNFVILSKNVLTFMFNVYLKMLCITNILNSLSVIRLREMHHAILESLDIAPNKEYGRTTSVRMV